ncbi:MAG: PBP1A family penicillin-binding protein [Spirochaetaceae bacterium]|jgi:penicillin-binding protein 1A|nr:PBP1A family penicillin-binding protein [Spirochaetaceae bacterium]
MKKRSGIPGFVYVLGVFTIISVAGIGTALGIAMAETVNIMNQENFQEFAPALPTKILDINGILITEFSADEKRELVSLASLPRHLIFAVLAREDPDFYKHKGFSIRGIARAAYGLVTGQNLGGGSTITQQVAGTLYTDRSERKISRKVRELWWALQMERRYTKNEILEIYLNYMYMGPGVYGVEAASKYFFGHSAKDISLAEAAILVIQLSSPAKYNPLDNPNTAMDRQLSVLNRMVELGYTTKADADASFDEYWESYDYTRVSQAAYYNRDDKAPWFSEYVRRELDGMMYKTMDYYRDGYTVYTTLDLNFQDAAQRYMLEGITRANKEYRVSSGNRLVRAERMYIPIVDLLSIAFDVNILRGTSQERNQTRALNRYTKMVNPVIDLAALAFGLDGMKDISNAGFIELKASTEESVVEGALILIENETGYIKALIGGSKYDENNQLIRATQGHVMPGSSFKPLYYSAAIDSGKFTPSSMIYDVPVVFHNEDGTPYIPLNFRGEWKGQVLLYDALAQSMNVPSLKILDTIGFDTAIDRAALLLGISDPNIKRRTFPHLYPIGLGTISIAPIQMARAFAVFANEGREVVPMAIRYIENRNGTVIFDNEREIRLKQRQKGSAAQLISPQNAYVMTGLLKKTVEIGTLGGQGAKFVFLNDKGERFHIAAAGKTGTTQNWSDAWTVGFTPYYTTAIWFGFDKPGNSLGLTLTGATLAGPIWGSFMREVHRGLPAREFKRPESGVVDIRVCAKSGQLLTPACNQGDVVLTFLDKFRPTEYCSYHDARSEYRTHLAVDSLRGGISTFDDGEILSGLKMPALDISQLPSVQPRLPAANMNNIPEDEPQLDLSLPTLDDFELPSYNPLMD